MMLKIGSAVLFCIHAAMLAYSQSDYGNTLWHQPPIGQITSSPRSPALSFLTDLEHMVSEELGDKLSDSVDAFAAGPNARGSGTTHTDYLKNTIERWRAEIPSDAWSSFLDGVEAENVAGDFEVAAEQYQVAAEAGVSLAMLFWGRALARGYGVERNTDAATYWLSKAMTSEHPYLSARSKEELAWMILDSDAADESGQRAVLLEEAANSHASAIPAYLNHLITTIGLSETDERVTYWVEKAADAGNVSALRFLFDNASDAKQDEIVSALQQIDNPSSYIALGDIYRDRDQPELAYKEYVRAASFDPYALAQASIILLHSDRVDGSETDEQAINGLIVAADQGEPSAAVTLAEMAHDPDHKYNLVRRAEGQDPDGRYTAQANSVRRGLCGDEDARCEEVQVAYITTRARSDGRGGTVFENMPSDAGADIGVARVVIRTEAQEMDPPSGWSWLRSLPCKVIGCSSSKRPRIDAPIVVVSDQDIVSFLDSIKKEIDSSQKASRRVIVYVHGYNSSFVHAAEQLALIVSRGVLGVPVLLSWPSGANANFYRDNEGRRVAAYQEDRNRAELSCPELRGALSEIVPVRKSASC